MKRTLITLVAVAGVTVTAAAQPATSFAAPPRQDLPIAYARFIQAAPDLGGVDVFLNGARAFRPNRFGQLSGYQTYAPGDLQVQVVRRGGNPQRGPIIAEATLPAEAGENYTLALAGTGDQHAVQIFTDSWDAPGKGRARARVIALSPGLAPTDVAAPEADVTFATGLEFGQASEYVDLAAGATPVTVTAAGASSAALTQSVTFGEGTINTLFLIGQPTGRPALSLATSADATATPSRLRVVNASPDAPALDVFADGQSIARNVRYSAITNYIDMLPGEYQLQLVPAGASLAQGPVLISTTVDLKPGYVNVLAAADTLDKIRPIVAVDEGRTRIPAGRGLMRVWHLSPDAPAVDVVLSRNVPAKVVENLSFGEVTDYQGVVSANQPASIVVAGTSDVALGTTVLVPDGGATTLYIFGLAGGNPSLSAASGRDR